MKLDCKDVWETMSEYIDQGLDPSVLAEMRSTWRTVSFARGSGLDETYWC
jgi:hypothetical protein